MSSRWSTLQSAADAVDRIPETRISRRQALRRGALATGALAGVSLLDAAPALAWWGSQPRPIPGGFDATFTPVPSNPLLVDAIPRRWQSNDRQQIGSKQREPANTDSLGLI